jgi:peroxiredoxin
MKRKMNLKMTVLSDDKLEVIERYKVRFDHGLTPTRGFIRPLAVPTTVLIDAEGIVRWVHTSRDYRVRIPPDEVLSLAQEYFSRGSGRTESN